MATTKVYANMLARLDASRMDGERLRRVAEAPSVSDALKMLGDYGYIAADGSIDGFIVAQTNALIRFIEENSADDRLKNALVAPFRYNNAKLAYKSRLADIPDDSYYDIDDGREKIAAGDYSECDDCLAAALEKLDAADEKRPQAIDLAITRAMYDYVLCQGAAVRKYFKTEIDLKNVLTAARLKRLNRVDADEFLDGGTLDIELLTEAAASSEGEFAWCFCGTPYEQMADELEASGFSELSAFERGADDFLFYITDSMCADMTSFQPFLNYYTQARIELKAIKTALVCLKTNARELFYTRIPKMFL